MTDYRELRLKPEIEKAYQGVRPIGLGYELSSAGASIDFSYHLAFGLALASVSAR
jgi:hypothetical protein